MNKCKHESCSCHSAPAVVVTQTVEGIKGLANSAVYVMSNNTTYYIDSCHKITVISSGPVYVDNYQPQINPLNLRGQTCYDFANNKAYVFNNAGNYRVINLEEA